MRRRATACSPSPCARPTVSADRFAARVPICGGSASERNATWSPKATRSLTFSLERQRHVADVEPETLREPHAVVQLRLQPLAVAGLHQLADHLACLRAPERVRGELRQHPV